MNLQDRPLIEQVAVAYATEIEELTEQNLKLRAALEFSADPETYRAIAFLPDPPCGEFIDDFSDDHGHEHYVMLNEETKRYDLPQPMPGKRARKALANANAGGK